VPLGAEPQSSCQFSNINAGVTVLYVFYPANFWPHKRHDLLFRIMSRLWQEQPDIHLVMTGGRSEADRQGLQDLSTRYRCPPERIHDLVMWMMHSLS